VFGQVVAGQEVLDLIGQTEVHTFDHFEQIPVRPVVIKAIRRVF
jgi:cyclophilin family peptidyl-prolyl cis-trans isomerase